MTTDADPLAALERAVDAGRERALDAFRGGLDVRYKRGPMDAVTDVDEAVQRTVGDVLDASGIDATLVAEEEDARATVPEGDAWVVDPIDGTNSYVRGSRLWAVSAAYVSGGEPVAAVTDLPALGDRYAAGGETRLDGAPVGVSDRSDPDAVIAEPIFGLKDRDREAYERVTRSILGRFGDLRRLGSAQTTLATLAAGEIDAAISTVELSPWDTVAGVHLVRRAGGTVTDLDGDPWRHDSPGLVASNGACHEDALAAAKGGPEAN